MQKNTPLQSLLNSENELNETALAELEDFVITLFSPSSIKENELEIHTHLETANEL